MGRRLGQRGAHVTLKHVHAFKDRHGKVRHYLRLPGVKAVPLKGQPGSPEFMAAYSAAVADYQGPDAKPPAFAPGTMRDLAFRYFSTTRYLAKAPSTRMVERQMIDRFMIAHGEKRATTIQTKHLDAIFAAMSDTPAAAMNLRKRLRALFKLAIKLGWRSDDPTAATDTFRLGSHHTWTEDEIAAFQAHWSRGTMQRTAFDLLLYSGQRSGDVRRFTWGDVRDGRIRVLAQEKTGAAVDAPLHPELTKTLEAHERKGIVVIMTQHGASFTSGFGNWMADAIAKAGLPSRCVPHGLRKAAARRLAEAGCTPHQVMAITGHRTLKEVERYTADASRKGMADEAMAKVIGMKTEHAFANRTCKPQKRKD